MRDGLLSVVVPAYDEEANVPKAAERIGAVLKGAGIEYEILFVDDGSSDRTAERILNESKKNPKVRGVLFSRNFGKEAAVSAGLAEARGDCVAVMDCDLQHPPETLVEMYGLWRDGCDVVEGVKRSRGKESALHRAFVRLFYGAMSKTAGRDVGRFSDFKLLDGRVVDEITEQTERFPFFRMQAAQVGFRTAFAQYDVEERTEGKSKWSFASLSKYAVRNYAGYSDFPLTLPFFLGAAQSGAGAVLLIAAAIMTVMKVSGAAFSAWIGFLLLEAGLVLASIGAVGYYVGRTFRETQGRKRWVIGTRIEKGTATPSERKRRTPGV